MVHDKNIFIDRMKTFSKGFTLIELLIVISIIGVLSALVLTNMQDATVRGRDSRRKNDLKQIQSALEMYRADIGSYAPASGVDVTSCSGVISSAEATYLRKVPCDPKKSAPYVYTYSYVNANTYSLIACLENANDKEKDAIKNAACNTANASFTVLSP